LMGSM